MLTTEQIFIIALILEATGYLFYIFKTLKPKRPHFPKPKLERKPVTRQVSSENEKIIGELIETVEWGKKKEEQSAKTESKEKMGSEFQTVASALTKFGGEATRTDLLLATGWKAEKLDQVLKNMMEKALVEAYRKQETGGAGPKPTVFKLVQST